MKVVRKIFSKIDNIRKRVEKIDKKISDNSLVNVNYFWGCFLILWLFIGTKIYNYFNFRGIIPQLGYYLITLLICSKNMKVISIFLDNPFKSNINITKILNTIYFYPYYVIMSGVLIVIIPEIMGWLQSDPQGLSNANITIDLYMKKLVMLPIVVFVEEICNLIIYILISNWLSKAIKKYWAAGAIILSSFIFGLLHVTVWNFQTAINLGLMHIPYFFSIAFLGNIWVSIIAHGFQNAIGYSVAYHSNISRDIVIYSTLFFIILKVISYFLDNLCHKRSLNK